MDSSDSVRREKIAKYAKWGIGLLGAVIISPIVFLAVKGLIGLGIALVVGAVIINAAPVVAMKLANLKIKGIVHEAQVNPIETLTNLLIEKRRAYATFKENVVAAATAAKDFGVKVQQFSQRWPNRADEFKQQLAAMNELVRRKQLALADAKNSLEEADAKLDEMKAYWEMSQSAQAANKAAGMDTGDIYEAMKAKVSMDAVTSSMNKAFAELEVAAALDSPQLLEHQPANVINADVKVIDHVGARR